MFKFALSGDNLIKVFPVDESKSLYLPVIQEPFVCREVFDTKEEASFQYNLRRLQKGLTSLKHLKRSKYFDYYIKRLSEEYPELLI